MAVQAIAQNSDMGLTALINQADSLGRGQEENPTTEENTVAYEWWKEMLRHHALDLQKYDFIVVCRSNGFR